MKSLERSVSLKPDFSPAGELLYICYMTTNKYKAAISLVEKVCDYNPICYYSFYYLGLEQIKTKNIPQAIDSIQNAIRLYYATYGTKGKLMKPDYPELTKELLLTVFSKVPGNVNLTRLHPSNNASIMWLHLCHCYMEQANFEGAHNCSNKALDDYLQSSLSKKKFPQTENEFTSLINLITEINRPNYTSKHADIEGLLVDEASDILSLIWNLVKSSFHLSILKETLIYSEIGLKAVSLLYQSSHNKGALKYAAKFVQYIMHSGCFIIDQLRTSAVASVSPHVIQYFKVLIQIID